MSEGGGTKPVWMAGGREIAYVNNRDVMSVAVATSPAFTSRPPVRLFTLGPNDSLLDVTRDGRFVVLR